MLVRLSGALRSSSPVAVAAVCLACAATPPPPSEPSPLLGSTVPGFQGQSIGGSTIETARFHGSPLVVSFFAESCEACTKTLPATQEMYADHHDVVVVGIYAGSVRSALRISKQYDLKFPVLVDADGAIAKRFSVDDAPKTFVADRNGWIRWVGGAGLTREALTSAVAAVR